MVKNTTRKGSATRKRPSAKPLRKQPIAVSREPGNAIIRQLDDIQRRGGDGVLSLGRGKTMHVSSLGKTYFPSDGFTKGDVMRYYATVAPMLLPVVVDRPLVLKRYPEGIAGPSFFQQNAGPRVPEGVRTARVATVGGDHADRIIGGDLLTLLYIVQIGAIAVHSWQARIQSSRSADSTTIDLDPGDDVPFSGVVGLANLIKVELDRLKLRAAVKTSGSSGLHIVLPLPPKMGFGDAARLAQTVAERVVGDNPRRATLERSVKARPPGTIYVDAQQNAEGKTIAAAYSLRERQGATVSAPLDWRELRPALRLESFTINTMPSRLNKVGDLWRSAMKRPNTQRAIERVLGGA
ncbi:MAG TPA: non-homologous end-joining DNA ligase [Gemmatimonadaceae bacterium]